MVFSEYISHCTLLLKLYINSCDLLYLVFVSLGAGQLGHLVNMHLKMLNTLSSAIYILEKQTAK